MRVFGEVSDPTQRGSRSLRHSRLQQTFDKDIPMREVAQVLAQHAGAQWRTYAIAAGDPFGRLLLEAEMAAAADQSVVVAGELRVGGDRVA